MNALESCEAVEFHRHVAGDPTLGPNVRRDNRGKRVLRAIVYSDDSIEPTSTVYIGRRRTIDSQKVVGALMGRSGADRIRISLDAKPRAARLLFRRRESL